MQYGYFDLKFYNPRAWITAAMSLICHMLLFFFSWISFWWMICTVRSDLTHLHHLIQYKWMLLILRISRRYLILSPTARYACQCSVWQFYYFLVMIDNQEQGQTRLPKVNLGELMALECDPAQNANNVQEGFTQYLSNKSCKRERFMTCPRFAHYNFSFFYKLSQFFLPLFPLDVTPNFLQMSRFADNWTTNVAFFDRNGRL